MQKNNSKFILFLILFFTIFLPINDIKAYKISVPLHSYTEEDIYNKFSLIEGFDINKYSSIACGEASLQFYCYAFLPGIELTYSENASNAFIGNTDCDYFFFNEGLYNSDSDSSGRKDCTSYIVRLSAYEGVYSNFDDGQGVAQNVLDFSEYMQEESVEDKIELEITTKASNILTFILDKSSNLYSVIINNEIFKLCIGVLISYLIFLIFYKLIRK